MNNVKVKALLLTVLVAASPLSAGWSSDWARIAKNGFGATFSKVAEIRRPFQWAWGKKGDVLSSCIVTSMAVGLRRAGSLIYNNPKMAALGLFGPIAIGGLSKVLYDKINKSSKASEKQAPIEIQKQAPIETQEKNKRQGNVVRVCKTSSTSSLYHPGCPNCSNGTFCLNHSGRSFPGNGRRQQTARKGCLNGMCS